MDFERLGPTAKGREKGTTSGPMEGDPKGIIFHHTEGDTVEGAIGGMNKRRNAVQYIIGLDKDGNAQVYQTLPGGHKGAHISSDELPTTGPYSKQEGIGISNANTIGIEMVGHEGKIDPKITAKAREFGLWLMKNNPNAVVLGHSDVNPRNKEGKDISTWLRENAPAKTKKTSSADQLPQGSVVSDAPPIGGPGQQTASLTSTPKILTPQDIAEMERQRIGAEGGYANNAARPPPPFLPPGMTPHTGPQYTPPDRLKVRSEFDPTQGLPPLLPGGKPVPVDTTQSLLRPIGSPDVGAPLDIRSDEQKKQDAPVHPNQPAVPRTQADVNKLLSDLASKRSKEKLNWKSSVVDTMKLLGMDSSQKSRIKLAKDLGYTGKPNSRSRNVWLQQKLRSNLLAPAVPLPYTGPDEGQGKGKRLDPNVPLEEQLGTSSIPAGPPLDITSDAQKVDAEQVDTAPLADQLGLGDIPGPSGRTHETVLGGTPFDAAGEQGAPGGPSGPARFGPGPDKRADIFNIKGTGEVLSDASDGVQVGQQYAGMRNTVRATLTPPNAVFPNLPSSKSVVTGSPPPGEHTTKSSFYGNFSEAEGSVIPGGWRDELDVYTSGPNKGQPLPQYTGAPRNVPGVSIPFRESAGPPGGQQGAWIRVFHPTTGEPYVVRQADIGPNMFHKNARHKGIDVNAALAELWGFAPNRAASIATGRPVYPDKPLRWEHVTPEQLARESSTKAKPRRRIL